VVCGDGSPVLEKVPKIDTTTVARATTSVTMSEEAGGDPTATTSLTIGASQTAAVTTSTAIGDGAPEEHEVIMGHPGLGAPR
jgi:hypothetical protein